VGVEPGGVVRRGPRRRTRVAAFGRTGLFLALAALFMGPSGILFSAAPARAQAAASPVRVVVAVLPFRVHSAQPLGYLERSLADLLESRLEASGSVTVVESLVVREAMLGYAEGDLTEEALRRLAHEVDADYIVAGSLTELAGRYSLDVRVTPVREGGTSHSLAFTARDDDELLDRMNELADRILGVLAGASPRATVTQVRLVGAEGLEPDPTPRLRLSAGSTYDAALASADVAMLKGLAGVAAASLETDRQAGGVVVTYRIVPSESLLAAPEVAQGEDRVGGVEVRGNRRIEQNAIKARISTRSGDRFEPARVAEDVRQIYALGFFRNVVVYSEDGVDGRILIFEVEENPVVRQVSISGNDSLDADKIRDILTLTTGATLDYPLLFENRARIEGLYRAEGYYLADVTTDVEALPNDSVAVDFHVIEGKKLRLRAIDFEGNEHFTDEELSRGFKTKPWRYYSYVTRFLDKSGTYSEPVFQQDLQLVVQKYQNAGYIQVEVDEADVVPEQDGLTVLVRLVEGRRYEVGKVDVVGDETLDLESLRERLLLKEGEWFDRSALTADSESLADRYRNRGFYFANVEPLTRVSEDELDVDVTFDVEKGPLYFIREIDISGNTTTIDPVIRREMQVVEGELYSARALRLSQGRMERLGFFEEVSFEPVQTDQPEELDMDVQVIERPTGSLSFGAGVSSQDGFVISGSLSQTNLFGRGYGANLSAEIGGSTNRYFLSFSDPYFLGSDWSASVTLFNTEIQFEDFDESRTGIELGLGRALDESGRTRGFVRYSYNNAEVDEDSFVFASSLLLRERIQGEESTSLVGVSFRRDTRDDAVVPTSGYQTSGSFDFAGLGGFSEFARVEGRYSWFTKPPEWFPKWFPFRDQSTFNFAARGGWAEPFNDISDYDIPESPLLACIPGAETCPLDQIDDDLTLPLTQRYFLGGIGTFQLRGFKARSVGPRRAILKENVDIFGFPDRTYSPIFTDAGVCSNPDGCNSIDDTKNDDFDNIEDTDVIGGSKFVSVSAEYRFPIAESLGLIGILFVDAGNAFDEETSIFEMSEWRVGTGFGGLWFSPFGPLQAFVGLPLDPLDDVEDSFVFEFSVGGAGF
jgi:outer membrane protein insertion porin family